MTTHSDEITNLRAELATIRDWALRAANACREPVEIEAWEAIADMAKRGLRVQRASVIVPVSRRLTLRERLTGWTNPSSQ